MKARFWIGVSLSLLSAFACAQYKYIGPDGKFVKKPEWIDLKDEPDHDGLCFREQEYFLKAIREDLDLNSHMEDAISSLAIVLAADRAFKEGRTVDLA